MLFVGDETGVRVILHEIHTGSNAHSGCADLGTLALQLREQSGDLAGTSTSEGMAYGDGTTIRVDLVDIQSQMLNAILLQKKFIAMI